MILIWNPDILFKFNLCKWYVHSPKYWFIDETHDCEVTKNHCLHHRLFSISFAEIPFCNLFNLILWICFWFFWSICLNSLFNSTHLYSGLWFPTPVKFCFCFSQPFYSSQLFNSHWELLWMDILSLQYFIISCIFISIFSSRSSEQLACVQSVQI